MLPISSLSINEMEKMGKFQSNGVLVIDALMRPEMHSPIAWRVTEGSRVHPICNDGMPPQRDIPSPTGFEWKPKKTAASAPDG
nr:hypothetical protein Iba_chr09eCG12330 [Ipomoea batatas]